MPNELQGEKRSVDVIGNTRKVTQIVLPEKLKSGNSRESATVERRAAASEVLRARPVEGEIDYDELSREHIARYRNIRAALAK